eukprot:6185365-Pleurochrysis_carterae.AAC.5
MVTVRISVDAHVAEGALGEGYRRQQRLQLRYRLDTRAHAREGRPANLLSKLAPRNTSTIDAIGRRTQTGPGEVATHRAWSML